jgi:hypothetical protein
VLTASHIEKFNRMEAALARLDPEQDRELWIWTAMNGLTHLLNAAMHEAGLTKASDSFHSQVDGLYGVPDRKTGQVADAMLRPGDGDVMHLGRPPVPSPLPVAIQRAGAALKVIEDLRVPFVRGDQPVPEGAPEHWRSAYAECRKDLFSILGPRRPQ